MLAFDQTKKGINFKTEVLKQSLKEEMAQWQDI